MVVLIGGAAVFFWPHPCGVACAPAPTPVVVAPAPAPAPKASGPAPIYATQGTLVSGFPKALLLDSRATLMNSFSISYSSTTNETTGVWASNAPVSSTFSLYQFYFSKNGWKIIEQTSRGNTRGISAVNASSSTSASVVIEAAAKGSTITISYLTR